MEKFIRYFIAAALAFTGMACSSDDNKESGSLKLMADRNEIAADGVEKATFVVTKDGVDVTAQSEIYRGTSRLEGSSFSTTETGEFRFTAKYEGALSNDFIVKAITPASFKKKVLVPIWTSVNCQWCPLMARQLKNVWMKERPGQVVPMYYHMQIVQGDDDPFIVRDGNGKILFEGDMASWFNCIGGAPKACVDAEYTITYQNGSSRLDIALNRQAHTGIAMETSVSGQTLKVKVLTKGDVDYSVPTGLAVWLLESGRVEPQKDGEEIDENYVHDYIVRAALCDDYKGVMLDAAYCKAGQEYVYEYTYTIPADFVKENLQIVAYVYQNVEKTVSSSGHLVQNAQMVNAGSNIDYEYSNETLQE